MSLNTEAYKAAWSLFPAYITDKAAYESMKDTRGFIYNFLHSVHKRMTKEEREEIKTFLEMERWL